MQQYVYFLEIDDPTNGSMTLRHDAGHVFTSAQAVIAGRQALVCTLDKPLPDGQGCWRDLSGAGYKTRSEHGVLWLSRLNPVTNSVGFDSDTGTLEKAGSRPFVRAGSGS